MKTENESRQKEQYNTPILELLGKITVVTQKSGGVEDNNPPVFPTKNQGSGQECDDGGQNCP